jgi:short-subunit dehydrogenase
MHAGGIDMGNVALITGASAGLGVEMARIHASRGGDLVLVARRGDRLEKLGAELSAAHGVKAESIALDLSTPEAASELHRQVQARGIAVEQLINNAGFGTHGGFTEVAAARYAEMIRLNISTLVGLTHLFLPEMVQRGSGRVMNVASMAGFLPGPFMAIYYATKAFVISFSEAIAEELDGTGVTVTALCPRATNTEFATVAGVQDTGMFDDADSAPAVAAYGYAAMLRGDVIAIPGFAARMKIQALRLLPRKTVRRISRGKKQTT